MAKPKINKYGFDWPPNSHPLTIEFWMIRKGKEWLERNGRSLFFHYKEAQKIIWPNEDHHRWSDLILKTICENEVSTIMGCADSTKTWSISKFALTDYWCFPDETLWLISTTEGRGSELRIFGAIKDLFNAGRREVDWLAGHPVDYLKTITTDEIDSEKREARSLRRGIIVIPCKPGSVASGLAPYIGIKSSRLRHAGDETQVMGESHLNAYANWFGKEDFKGINAGNFMETDDPLGIAAEPEDGWDSFEDTEKTQTWRGRFYRAAVVALDGRDSPNSDYPEQPNGRRRFPYMISKKKLDAVAETKGKDSWEWYSQCIGKPVKGMDIWRVLRKDFCRKHKAMDEVVWKGSPRINLYPLDPAYGLGDRCVGRRLEFGEGIDGTQILLVHPPEIIPISINTGIDAETQIATFIQNRLHQLGIPPQNCFYDSFGRGTLGFSFSKVFGSVCPVPVDSGAQPSSRPVRFDLFVEERNGDIRLKRCDEHYTKFVSELWFSVSEAIESEQIRGLDMETLREGCARKFTKNSHNKIEVEPKEDMKERLNRSPDLMDNLAIGIEGARRLGFKIQRLMAEGDEVEDLRYRWFHELHNKYSDMRAKRALNFAK